MNIKRIVADNVRKYRKEKGMTQLELGKLVGYTGNNGISLIEKAATDTPLSKLAKIAEVLDVKVIDLVEEW